VRPGVWVEFLDSATFPDEIGELDRTAPLSDDVQDEDQVVANELLLGRGATPSGVDGEHMLLFSRGRRVAPHCAEVWSDSSSNSGLLPLVPLALI